MIPMENWPSLVTAAAGMALGLPVFLLMSRLKYFHKASEARRREVEQSLHSTEKQLAEILASINEVLWTSYFPNQGIDYVSPAVERVYGRPPGAFYDNPRLWFECIHPKDKERVLAFARTIRENGQAVIHYRIMRPDGAVRWLRYAVHVAQDDAPGRKRVSSVGSDVTEEYLLQESLRRSHRALRAIHDCGSKIAQADDENALLQGICEVVVEAGYMMAWTGLLQDDGESMALTNIAGKNQGYIESIRKPLIDEPQRLSTIESALRTRRPVTARNFAQETHLPWRLAALRHGFHSKVALPLIQDERILGVLNVYAAEENAFDEEELGLLEGLARSVMLALQSLRNRDQRKTAEAALYLRQRAIEASANAIVITSADWPDYPVEYVNPAFERMTGYTAQDIIGQSMRILHGDDREQAGLTQIRAILSQRREGHATLRNYRKDGTLFWSRVHIAPVKDDTGAVGHFVAAKYDVTETKHYQDELESQANHDALTGLANRKLLRERLHRAIASSSGHDGQLWVGFLDLDHFKFVNDSLGHSAGDLLLQQIAKRVQHVLRDGDTVARQGGDEFILILPAPPGAPSPAHVLQLVMDVIAQPLKIDGHSFHTTCSIGIAVYPQDGEDPETLIKHADIALYHTKKTGRNDFQFFTPAMNKKALERLRLETDLRRAIERDEFVLHYQPKISLKTGSVHGMEALIRWQHPELGMIFPDRFISLAEETGLIVPIGNWVLRNACLQNKAWQDAGLAGLRVAVNLSARQFGAQDLAQAIAAILQETRLAPQYLEIELTESLLMTDVKRAIDILRDLKRLGLALSLDDFGTGYSSLSYLTRLPIDTLKIDQSFIREISANSSGAAIVAAIIGLAHSLRLQVIAEGVETPAQLRYLRQKGCDQIQGYYFSKPLTASELEQTLRQGGEHAKGGILG